MANEKSTLLVCCHKPGETPQHPVLLPIFVGSAISTHDLPIQRDDAGENISDKNGSYCELTALYWAWKNMEPTQYVGLAHYRRYFDLKDASAWANLSKRGTCRSVEQEYVSSPEIGLLLREADVVLPRLRYLSQSVGEQYRRDHRWEDMLVVREVLQQRYPDYVPDLDRLLESHHFSPYNMFIARWEWFDAYCAWLFDVLGETERRITLPDDVQQRRVFGFLAERLLNLYCLHHRDRIVYRPVFLIGEGPGMKVKPNVRYQFKRLWYCLRRK